MSSICGATAPVSGTRLVIGPGTGLGVGALAYNRGRYHSVTGEGGHIGISPRTRYEVDVFEALRKTWPEVFFDEGLTLEAEGVLSGTGLPMVFQAVQGVEVVATTSVEPEEIFEAARAGTDLLAVKVVSIFKAHLAQVAGDLGLTLGATGGVFLIGGIALKNAWLFDTEFVSHFQAGGRSSAQREKLDLYLFNRSEVGLLGARNFAIGAMAT